MKLVVFLVSCLAIGVPAAKLLTSNAPDSQGDLMHSSDSKSSEQSPEESDSFSSLELYEDDSKEIDHFEQIIQAYLENLVEEYMGFYRDVRDFFKQLFDYNNLHLRSFVDEMHIIAQDKEFYDSGSDSSESSEFPILMNSYNDISVCRSLAHEQFKNCDKDDLLGCALEALGSFLNCISKGHNLPTPSEMFQQARSLASFKAFNTGKCAAKLMQHSVKCFKNTTDKEESRKLPFKCLLKELVPFFVCLIV